MNRREKRRRREREKRGNKLIGVIASGFFIGITAVYPLYLARQGYLYMTGQKTTVFCFLTAAAAVVLIALLVYSRRLRPNNYYIDDEPKRPVSVSEWALLAFLALTFLSAVFSPWQETVWKGFTLDGLSGRWEGFWAFLCYGLTFLIIGRFYRPKRLHLLIFAASAIIVSMYGVSQFLGFDILESSGFIIPEARVQEDLLSRVFFTTIGNSNVVAAYCSLVTALFAALFAGEGTRWGALYWAASSLTFALLLISGGRGAMVGLFGAMLLLVPYWLSDRERLGKICIALSGWCAAFACYHGYIYALKRSPNLSRFTENDQNFIKAFAAFHPLPFAALAAVLLAAGLCLLLLLKRWPERTLKTVGILFLAVSIVGGIVFVEIAGAKRAGRQRDVVWQAREMMHGRIEDNFGSNRGWIWKRGVSAAMDNPVLGTGPDTFYFALGEELQIEAYERYGVIFDKAHNSFLQIAVCMGLPALIAYLVFLAGLFLPSVKAAFNRPLLLAFGAAALSYLLQCFFEVDTPIDRPLLWVALGVMAVELWRERIKA